MQVLSFPDRGRAHHQAAVRHGLGDAGELPCLGKNVRRIHRRPRRFQAHGVVIHQPQIGKAKTMHGARDGADIVRVARPHQHYTDPPALLFTQHLRSMEITALPFRTESEDQKQTKDDAHLEDG